MDSAEGLLKQVEASCRGLMSPLLRSRQLLLWAHLHYARACCALNMGQPAVQDVVKALVACERARALSPSCWRKVSSWSATPPPLPLCPPSPKVLPQCCPPKCPLTFPQSTTPIRPPPPSPKVLLKPPPLIPPPPSYCPVPSPLPKISLRKPGSN